MNCTRGLVGILRVVSGRSRDIDANAMADGRYWKWQCSGCFHDLKQASNGTFGGLLHRATNPIVAAEQTITAQAIKYSGWVRAPFCCTGVWPVISRSVLL